MSDPRDPELKPEAIHAWAWGGLWCGLEKRTDLKWSDNWAKVTCAPCLALRPTATTESSPTPGALVGEPLTAEQVERVMGAVVAGEVLGSVAGDECRRLFGEAWHRGHFLAALYFFAWQKARPPRDATWREGWAAGQDAAAKVAEQWFGHTGQTIAGRIRSLVPPASPPTPRGGEPTTGLCPHCKRPAALGSCSWCVKGGGRDER